MVIISRASANGRISLPRTEEAIVGRVDDLAGQASMALPVRKKGIG